MRESHPWLWVALIGCGAAQTADPQAAPSPAQTVPAQSTAAPQTTGESVTLNFGWKPGLRLRFEETVTQGDENAHSSRSVEVVADPQGLRLVASDVDPGMAEPPPDMSAEVVEVLNAVVAKVYPVVFLEADGTFVDAKADDVDLEAMVAGLKENERGFVMMIAGMLASGAQMQMRNSWEHMVSDWNGVTLLPGEPLESDGTVMAGIAGEIPVRVRKVLVGRVPCSEGAAPDSCVHLRQTKSSGERAQGEATIEMSIDLVTEPDTLIPHSFKMAAATTVTMDLGSGAEETTARSTIDGTYTVLR